MIVFDIETGPLSDDVVFARVKPFEAPLPPAEFDPSSVKVGNLKDQKKIEAKIEAEKKKHDKAVENHEAGVKELEHQWRTEQIDKAPLDPLTGQVLAIGYQSGKGVAIQTSDEGSDELVVLGQFWERYRACRRDARKLVGHNIFEFDLPFLVRRSWILGVDVPDTILSKNRYWDDRVFVDTMKVWSCGKYNDWSKLDTLAKAFGGDGKPDDVDGGMFHKLFKGTPDQRQQAIDYLKNDLEQTALVANHLLLS